MRAFVHLPAILLAAAAAAVLAACGGDDRTAAPSGAAADAAPAAGHVHGLGIDPADGRLLIATHHGLLAAEEGRSTPRRVGDSREDLMGFTVAGPGHFVASGHPAPGQALPPNLGLVESRDGGRTWRSVSLLGEADFHVLERSGRTLYGFDGTQGRLMVSRDAGRTWEERTPPAGVFGLAIHPADASRVVASTERGLFASSDGARTWKPLDADAVGLPAWPHADRLYLVDGSGRVQLSGDGGATWKPQGQIGGQPAAFEAAGDVLLAALADGTVKRSTDGGASWTVRTTALS